MQAGWGLYPMHRYVVGAGGGIVESHSLYKIGAGVRYL
jgi:hypothetical protein